MKQCSACQKSLPSDLFTIDRSKEDGLSHKCKSCQRQYRISKGLTKPDGWERKTADKKAYARAWKLAHPGYDSQKKKEWLQRNPKRAAVKERVKYALKTGKLVRWPCQVCGEAKVDAHHPDYDNPLGVVWLCKDHHNEVHSSNPKAG